jgi:hypothetical protein
MFFALLSSCYFLLFSTLLFPTIVADQLCIAAQSGKTCMIQQNSSIACWGSWRFPMPTPIEAIENRFTHLACTDWNMFAIHKYSNRLLAWGTDYNLLLSLYEPVWFEGSSSLYSIDNLALENIKCGTDLCCFKALLFDYVYCFRTEFTLSMYTRGYVNTTLPTGLVPLDTFSAVKLTQFDVGPTYVCGIQESNKKIICAGYYPPDISSIEHEEISDVVCSWANICVQFLNTSISCVGANLFGETEVPELPFHTLVGKIASSNNHCGLYGKTNKLVCWGSNTHGQLRYIPSFPVSQFMLSFDVMCGITASSMPFCYGLNIAEYNLHKIPQTATLLHLGEVPLGDTRFVLYNDYTMSSLAQNSAIELIYSSYFHLDNILKLYQHEDKLVVYLQNGTVKDSFCELFIQPCPHTSTPVCQILYGRTGVNVALVQSCLHDELSLSVLMPEYNLVDAVETFNSLHIKNVTSLSYDGDLICYINKLNWQPECQYMWINYTVPGEVSFHLVQNQTIFSSLISSSSMFTHIVAKKCNFCVLNQAGEIECGQLFYDLYDSCTFTTKFTLENIPSGFFSKLYMSENGMFVCALELGTNFPFCWGSIPFLNNPPVDVGFQQLSLGETSICGLTLENFVLCWGDNLKGEMNPLLTKSIKPGELAPLNVYKEGVYMYPCQGISTIVGSTKPQCQGLCPYGYILLNDACVLRPCLDGSVRDKNTKQCVLCPAGKAAVQDSCVPCSSGTFTPHDGAVQCLPCGSNTFTPFSGSTACLPCSYPYNNGSSCFFNFCSPGLFANVSRIALNASLDFVCQDCPLGTYSVGSSTICSTCSANSYAYTTKSTSCFSCFSLNGIKCVDGLVEVQNGFFPYVGNDGFYALSCSYKYCKGGQYMGNSWAVCGPNREESNTNLFCGRCKEGYSDVNGDCVPCKKSNPGIIFMFVVVLWSYVVFLHFIGQASSNSASITIFFYFIQTSFTLLSPVDNYLNWLAFFNFNPQESTGSLCAMPLSAYEALAISFCLPFIFMGFLLLTFLIHYTTQTYIQIPFVLSPYKRTLINIVLFSYSQIIASCLNFLYCIDVPGEGQVNYAYPAIRCDAKKYRALYAPIVFLLVLNILLVPLFILYLLRRNKHRLQQKSHVSFSMLFLPFQEKSYFWQVVILLRRVIIAVVSTFLLTHAALRAFCSTIFNMIFLLLQLWRRPFVLDSDNYLEFSSLVLLVVISSIQAYSPPPSSDTASIVISMMIVLIYSLFFALFMIHKVYRKFQNRFAQNLNTIELAESRN